jgi:hypothetical protein
MASALKLIHVFVAFWFVAGLIGRGITLGRARSSDDIRDVATLVDAAGRFEKLMVIPASIGVLVTGLITRWAQGGPFTGHGSWWVLAALLVFLTQIPLVPLVFLPRGKIFEAALEDAKRRGTTTPELASAFRDRAVAAAHTYELITVAVVIWLMVLKPF